MTNDEIASAVDTLASEVVPYSECLTAAAQIWTRQTFADVPVNQEAAVAIARILYRTANYGEEPPQVLADLDEETRACLNL